MVKFYIIKMINFPQLISASGEIPIKISTRTYTEIRGVKS